MSTQRKAYKNHLKRFSNNSSSSSNNNSSSTELTSLLEMFPDWESDDLSSLLAEHNNILEVVIDLIVNNKVSKWEPIKKEAKNKKKDKENDEFVNVPNTNVTSNNTTHSSSADHGHKLNKYHKEAHPSNSKSKFSSKGPHNKKPNPKFNGKDSSPSAPTATATTSTSTSTSGATSGATSVPSSNSWAAALSKDGVKVNNKSHKESNSQPETELEPEPEPELAAQAGEEPEIIIEQTTAVIESTDTPTSTTKPALKEATVPQPKQGSWASAITPKPKSKPRTKQVSGSQEESFESKGQFEQAQEEPSETIIIEETATTIPAEAIPSEEVSEQPAQVVLPTSSQPLGSVGVSFGSLSLGDEEKESQPEQATEEIAAPVGDQTQQQQQQQRYGLYNSQNQNQNRYNQQIYQQQQQHAQQQHAQQQHAQQQQQPQQSQQTQQQQPQQPQQSQQQQPQQPQQQQPQQPYNQSKQQQQQQQQQYDYYNQFQQSQYPQQGSQTLPGAQFGVYPGMDYSAYNQQAAAVISSPAASPAATANYAQYAHAAGQPPSSGAQEGNVAAQSPITSQINPNTLQQQVPAAPFGYPYYNYYYNTPFYGNGAGLGAQGGFGNVAAAQGTPTSNSNATPNNGVNSGFMGVGNTGASQYYGQPNQFGNRYPGYNSYPQPGQAQSAQSGNPSNNQSGSVPASQGDANDSSSASNQAGNQQSQIPQQSQQPQQPVIPQYGGYQQYPQYGGYQDNNQYRGWY